MIKDMVAIVQGGGKASEAVELALELAAVHRAHIQIGVVSERVMRLAAFDPMGRYRAQIDAERDHEQQVQVVRAQADGAPVECEVRSLHQDPLLIPGRVDMRSRCTDLVLIPPEPCWSDRRLRRRVVEAVLGCAGAPTLLVPAIWHPEPVRHAVLAWNESVEAAQAARALKTMLEPGATVDVVVVEPLSTPDGRTDDPGSEIVGHLARHGYASERHVCQASGRPVAEVLQTFATLRHAQLLAIGAYAHSRVRELIFGGTTRELIAFQRLPILMMS